MLADAAKLLGDLGGSGIEQLVNRAAGWPLHSIAPSTTRHQPVISLPGYMASDRSLERLNRFLRLQGFNAHPWPLGTNSGPGRTSWNRHFDRVARHLASQIRRLADESSSAVSLVGHSLGGIYARELAARLPHEIDRVITLGSPTIHPYKNERHNKVIRMAAKLGRQENILEFGGPRGLLHWTADSPKIPCVAIHSPIDGLVHEDACHIPGYIVARSHAAAPRENLRVLATHTGMPVNPWVLLAIADRLLADRKRWKLFDPTIYFPLLPRALLNVVYPRGDRLYRDRGTAAFVEMHR
jgi:pimeloyl-ACP methyl ester carboxylesterase